MFAPKSVIQTALSGSSSIRSVSEASIIEMGKSAAEKKALKVSLDAMCDGGEVAWCLHTKKGKQSKQCWETGTPRHLPFSHGRVGKPNQNTASFSI